jgi:hypothetical protein
MLLSKDDPAYMQVIADKADWLIPLHVPQGHDACATIAADEDRDGASWW